MDVMGTKKAQTGKKNKRDPLSSLPTTTTTATLTPSQRCLCDWNALSSPSLFLKKSLSHFYSSFFVSLFSFSSSSSFNYFVFLPFFLAPVHLVFLFFVGRLCPCVFWFCLFLFFCGPLLCGLDRPKFRSYFLSPANNFVFLTFQGSFR